MFNEPFCSEMQVSGTGVISQSFPIFKHEIFLGIGKRFKVWKAIDEPYKITGSLIYTGLLENDLADPNLVWILFLSPGKGPSMFTIPFYQ